VSRSGVPVTCHTQPGATCPFGSHTWPTAGKALALSAKLTAASASGASLAGGPDNIALIVRRLAHNSK
jgi:hypothetical protein